MLLINLQGNFINIIIPVPFIVNIDKCEQFADNSQIYQSMTTIDQIINDATTHYGSNTQAAIAEVAKKLLSLASPFKLLSNYEIIESELNRLTTNATPQKSLLSRANPAVVHDLLAKDLESVGKLLSCDHDEHAYILAALMVLARGGTAFNAEQIITEILANNLHRIAAAKNPSVFVGRDTELQHILRVLSRRERNHVLIVGDTGVGKTTLAQAAAVATNLPVFQPTNINTDILYQLVTLKSKKNETVTFVDELISFNLKQIFSLLPHTSVIATANELAYRRLSQDNPELLSKFEVISLTIPSKEEVLGILHAHSHDLGLSLDKNTADTIYEMSKKYLDRPQFPARALGVFQEAVVMAKDDHNQVLSTAHIQTIISQKSNIPISTLTKSDKQDLASLPSKLRARVKGQDHAIDIVSRTVQRARLGIGSRNRPMGSFLFVGPSGVGKTELAKALAESLYGDSEAMVRIDMSEYAQEHTVQRLIGAPPGYIGFEEGGQLTNPIKKKPYSLILLDEIEKAHPRIFDIFLQVLDDGRLTDGRGESVDFKNTVIVATSNAGIEDILDLISNNKSVKEIDSEVKEILEDYFRLEFLNRFDSIVTFGALSAEALSEIARVHLDILISELKLRGISFSYNSSITKELAEQSTDPRYGARGLIRLIQDKIENTLAEKIVSGELKEGDQISF